jgi:hypothetical protein
MVLCGPAGAPSLRIHSEEGMSKEEKDELTEQEAGANDANEDLMSGALERILAVNFAARKGQVRLRFL